ncbi:putative monooxygenase, partial [Ilyonectria sp. MPI-CAGE-AT-0026]
NAVTRTLPDDTVIISGGGPIGMVTALILAAQNVKSIVLEKNFNTTKWPKMDLTNVRSMELFRKLGIEKGIRERGVPSHFPYRVLMTSGLHQDEPITRWDYPSVEEYRELIKANNDGTQPREPYQRISQETFEAWLKELCDENPLIDLKFGRQVQDVNETTDMVEVLVVDPETSQEVALQSRYLIGCDGASSITRRALSIPLDGGPVPESFLLVHFKSRDFAKLHKQGRFWHIFTLEDGKFGGAAISQDENEVFTIHLNVSGAEADSIASEDAVYRLLGGIYGPYKFKIDKILVRSSYRPSIAVARSFISQHGHAYLAGDAAHQNIPTGGYGMNTGLGDAFDIGWKLGAVVNGYGRDGLLKSYEVERRPVSIVNVERSGVHMKVHMEAAKLSETGIREISQGTEKGKALKEQLHQHYQENRGENTDFGIEMDYRYRSAVCIPDETATEPKWVPNSYCPSTWPGSRAPHVFLTDGSAVFDFLGEVFTLVEFRDTDQPTPGTGMLIEAANALGIPLKHVYFVGEDHAAKLWERSLVIVRPDFHVGWRGNSLKYHSEAYKILETLAGY